MPAAVRVALGVLVTIVAVLGLDGATAQEGGGAKRLALVIGEAAYPQARLPTANADAGLMATSLAQAGFAVTALADADAPLLRRATADFAAKARSAGPGVVLVVYVSGYGLQYAGENWLVPVGAKIDGADDVPEAAVRLAELSAPLEAVSAAARLFLFDIARETPFARKGQPLAPGLALADAPVGSLYAYNTAPGAVAPADVPPYGSYARALAEAIQAPGLTIGEVLRRVRLRAGERTDGAAVPFDDGSGDPGFAFFPGPRAEAAPLAAIAGLAPSAAYSTAVARDTLPGYADFVVAFPRDPLVGRVRAMAAARREALFWSEAVRANTPRGYWTYLRRYPRGPHLVDVRRQLFALHAALEPPPRFDIVPFEGLPPPPAEETAALEHLTFADADGPTIPPPPASLLPPPRGAFFDTLPPPPLAPAGSLALPLPVPTPDGRGPATGAIEQPAVPGGALLATLAGGGDGLAVITVKPDTTIVSRLSAMVEHKIRTEKQTASSGAAISKVTIATAADGALTMTQVGPADRPLGRSVSRDVAAGGRLITLFDAGGQAVAATIVSAADIVTRNGAIPGRTLPPRFVLLATPDAKGGPAIAPEGEAPKAVVPAGPPSVVPSAEAGKAEATGKDEPKAAPLASADAGTAKPPALPAAAGLTGQAPALNIPPPPPTPAFDAAAAPVAAAPPASEGSAAAAKPPGPSSASTAPVPPAPTLPPPAPPPVAAPTIAAPPSVAPVPAPTARPEPSPVPQPKPPVAAGLPTEPPLPPRRARVPEPNNKSRGRR